MSLIELCVSVLVISIVAVAATPSLIRARESYELDAAARQVAGKMQHARIKAISRSRDCRIRVTSEISYLIECEDPTWNLDENGVLPRGFRISANSAPQFHKHGNASPAGTITIWNSGLRAKRVVVNIAGRVRIE